MTSPVRSVINMNAAKGVMFKDAYIIEFEPTLHTATVTSGGVPIGMSGKERSRVRRRLDSFEIERKVARVTRENYMQDGYIEPEERQLILGNSGQSLDTISRVEREMSLIIDRRKESNETDFGTILGMIMATSGDDDEEEEEASSSDSDTEEEQEDFYLGIVHPHETKTTQDTPKAETVAGASDAEPDAVVSIIHT